MAGVNYFPLILSFFWFLAVLNIIGLLPYVFTPTAHLVVTFGLSFSIMLSVTLLGVWRFKLGYLSLLVPRGVPLLLAPLLGVIETLSYVIRALSLGLRLGANLLILLWGMTIYPVRGHTSAYFIGSNRLGWFLGLALRMGVEPITSTFSVFCSPSSSLSCVVEW